MNRIYVTGSTGQLGGELKSLYPEATFLTRNDVDLLSEESILGYFKDKKPDLIINCAAYTQVDRAESDIDSAFKANATAPAILAGLSDKFIHFSTDYVFDGTGQVPYSEDMPPQPIGVYGASKCDGEKQILKVNPNAVIIRTSWVYSHLGHNFVKTMIRLGREREELKVVCDQIGSPTYAMDLANLVLENGIKEWKFKGGIYHFSNEGVTNWCDFAREIMECMNIPCKILPITTAEYPTPAKRPQYSVLDKTKIKNELGVKIPFWKESLKLCLQKLS